MAFIWQNTTFIDLLYLIKHPSYVAHTCINIHHNLLTQACYNQHTLFTHAYSTIKHRSHMHIHLFNMDHTCIHIHHTLITHALTPPIHCSHIHTQTYHTMLSHAYTCIIHCPQIDRHPLYITPTCIHIQHTVLTQAYNPIIHCSHTCMMGVYVTQCCSLPYVNH